MNLIERINFIEKLSNSKKIIFQLLCCERCYRELYKVIPNFLDKNTKFQYVINSTWNSLKGERKLKHKELKELFSNVNKLAELEIEDDEDNIALIETARVVNLLLASFIWENRDNIKATASCAEKSGEVVSSIYENENDFNEGLEWYRKEIQWLAKALHLIAESEKIPRSYEWFLENNPDYERGKISKEFIDID